MKRKERILIVLSLYGWFVLLYWLFGSLWFGLIPLVGLLWLLRSVIHHA